MNFGDQLRKIRRFLRDPNGNIWSRSFLKATYNDVQSDIQRRLKFLEQIAVLNYPPRYQLSYLYDWEWPFLTGSQFYQALRYHDQSDYTFSSLWEAQSDYGVTGVVNDSGFQFTHPWEAFTGDTPAVPIPIKFPDNFRAMKFLAWDKRPLEFKSKKSITRVDTDYKTREGTPVFYYREDDLGDSFIPYPRPSTISWDDEITPVRDVLYVYAHDWESSYATGEQFTRNDSTNSRDYVFLWEIDLGTYRESYMRGMWMFEVGTSSADQVGQVSYLEDDDNDTESGTIMRRDGSMANQDAGVAIDILDIDNEFFMIFESGPTDIQDDTDESDFPIFLRKYIEYGVLERAYGALTDGKIQSLKEYWGNRYMIGIEAIKLYMLKKKTDRDYQLRIAGSPARKVVRHPKLPSTYPAL